MPPADPAPPSCVLSRARENQCGELSKLAAARAPRAATQQPRRRVAWLRTFVVRCGLPCDPPVGGHSCNGEMIPRFECAVCGYFTLGSAAGSDCQNLKAVTVVPASVVRPQG